ncbi:12564_t:CDS:2 [Funneliformis geosporum]|uniref:12564_t:CDS:1 n=1 Tax=Funneliformis geosporum TaxID=1117311 RepID=A0A9W4SPR4_9GLOM|nr:12564_t:CDS:2 [Funneliformis geosporum]
MSCGTFKDYGERWISYIFIDNAIVINMLKDELKRVQIFDLEAKKKNGSAITKTESSSFHAKSSIAIRSYSKFNKDYFLCNKFIEYKLRQVSQTEYVTFSEIEYLNPQS